MSTLAKEISGMIIAAVIGGIFSQFAVPLVIPYIELWTFKFTNISLFSPNFRVTADPTVSQNEKDYLTYSRVFCGVSLSTIKYCLQQEVVPVYGDAPEAWKLETNESIRVIMLGLVGEKLNGSFINTESSSVGIMRTARRYGSQEYTGVSYGCLVFKKSDPKWLWYPTYYGDLKIIAGVTEKSDDGMSKVAAIFSEQFKNIKTPDAGEQLNCASMQNLP